MAIITGLLYSCLPVIYNGLPIVAGRLPMVSLRTRRFERDEVGHGPIRCEDRITYS